MTQPRRHGWAALLVLTSVELVVFLDTTVVNVALPAIGAGLALSESGLAWVVGAYQLTFGGFQLVGGRAADLLGRRRLFATGVAVFTTASLLAGLSSTAGVLLMARAGQGVGAALVVPAEISLLAATFTEPAAYARAFGVWSAMGAAGAASGTALGGILTQGLGWHSIFLVNVPIGVAALALAGRLLPADGTDAVPRRWGLDVPGAISGTGGLVLVVYAATAASDGFRTRTALALAAGLIILAGFVLHEKRAAAPLLPLRLFRVRDVAGSTVVNFLVGAAHVPAFVLLALYLQNVAGYSPMASGFAVLPVALVNLLVARTVLPRALRRHGARRVLTAGMLLLAAGLGGFASVPVRATYVVDVLPASLVFGLGLPAAFAGVTIPAVSSVAETDTGITSGIVQTAQRVGSALGVAAATAIASAWTTAHPGPHLAAYNSGLGVAFAAAAAVAALGAVVAATFIGRNGQHPAPIAEDADSDRLAEQRTYLVNRIDAHPLMSEPSFKIAKLLFNSSDTRPTAAQDRSFGRWKQVGDPLADALVARIQAGGAEVQRQFELALHQGIATVEGAPGELADFFAAVENVPYWVDPASLERGSRVYQSVGADIMRISVMGLSMSYLARDGNEVLLRSGDLRTNAARRAAETTSWLMEVTSPGALYPGGIGYQAAVRVRLTHAFMRSSIRKRPDWPDSELPIHQSAYVATPILFSIVTMGLAIVHGHWMSHRDREAVLHLWRYVSHLVGVSPELIAANVTDQWRLLATQLHHQVTLDDRTREGSRELGTALIGAYGALFGLAPDSRPERRELTRIISANAAIMHLFLGKQGASALGYAPPRWSIAPRLVGHFLVNLARRCAAYSVPGGRRRFEDLQRRRAAAIVVAASDRLDADLSFSRTAE